MTRTLILATAGAGGDLQPLIATALGLRQRRHELFFVGDASVAAALQPLGLETTVLAPEYDLGPQLIASVRDSQGLPEVARGEFVKGRLSAWASTLAPVVRNAIRSRAPDQLVSSLFGVQVAQLATAEQRIPWAIINSTFYLGPHPPRPLELDLAPRA